MRLSHKRKRQKKLSKWRPFFIETLKGDILTHNLNKPFPKAITSKFAYTSKIPMKRALAGWKSDINIDMSVISLKNSFPDVSDYLCAQVHLLNILCRTYGLRHLRYKVPFMQLYTGCVQDKIKTNTDVQNSHSKGNCEPFKHPPLKGYNHSHIELFSYSRLRHFEKYKVKLIKRALKLLNDNEVASASEVANQVGNDLCNNTLKKGPNKRGKVTGFWLISKTVNEEEKYLCVTPHSNKANNDKCIKSVIVESENYSI
ncbi:hypothetical protein AN214_04029 [Pseudoalteromonas sp. P1-9]|uniref:hypothetical protein n=1 Tax=Pseudoalteromonas sp. P1-9 TaxID=1710354 RepID=UPI00070845A5|nr:hypothetical protein [Pseudoalteromonas sp. P1-9]KPV93930.1 hypothetical protein AN214_04029 [Pseudoalteromonas sp. P1-9]